MNKDFYYGVAYYPESWNSDIVADIDLMKEYGFNTVRIGEFAWSTIEKREGDYDFSLFRKVVDYCKSKNMYVLICTPTACPPIWLVQKDKNVLLLNNKGRRLTHGARRNTCENNKTYLDACDKIVEMLAKEFGQDENVIGWQVDNEVYIDNGGIGCICPDCINAYQEFLRRKYKTVDNLNKQWNCNIWSLEYDDFSQIKNPNCDIWEHPSSKSVWNEYQNELITTFIHRQINIIKKYTNAPVSTDMMPLLGLSYDDMGLKTDVVQFNHYNFEDDLWTLGLWCDFIRAQKDKAFWITETSPNWNGSEFANYSRKQGFLYANVMLPVVLGAEMNLFWLWKAHYGGHEIMHGAVIDSWGRPTINIDEITQIGVDLQKVKKYLLSTEIETSDIAIHFTHSAWNIFDAQSIVPEFNYQKAVTEWVYKPLADRHFKIDVIGANHKLNGYKVLISPFTVCLDEYGAYETAMDYVKDGGTWIVYPLTDIRTLSGAKYLNAPLGHLEDVLDVRVDNLLPKGEQYTACYMDGTEIFTVNSVYYAMTARENAVTLATYKDGYLKGKSAITQTSVGKGKIILLGFIPDENSTIDLIKRFVGNLCCINASANVKVVNRVGETEMFCAVEFGGQSGIVEVPYDCKDLLSGDCYKKGQEIKLLKYGYIFAVKNM